MKRMGTRLVFCLLAITLVLGLAAASADPAFAGKWKRKSQEHEDACNAWCNSRDDCSHCSTLRNCGSGFETIRSWTGYGKNWHACAKRESRQEASDRKSQECNTWCEANPGCRACRKGSCLATERKLKSWRGRGKNWHACEVRVKSDRASQNNYNACREYCREQGELCTGCDTARNCRASRVALKHFGGKGQNWHACGWRQYVKAHNKANCEAWCGERENCIKCSEKRGCGYGYSRMKSFSLGGTSANWHACKRRSSAYGTIDAGE